MLAIDTCILHFDFVDSDILFILGQVSTLFKVIKNDRTPVLRNLVLLPLLVQQEVDVELQVGILNF